MKIVLASDNHGDKNSINKILNNNPDADYYIHCGDACLSESDMSPFACVKGNNDYFSDFPKERTLELGEHKVFITHGHKEIYYSSLEDLANKAKANGCDLCFFGHVHEFVDMEVSGVRFINPGSTFYNRDGTFPTYAIVYIDSNGVSVEKHLI